MLSQNWCRVIYIKLSSLLSHSAQIMSKFFFIRFCEVRFLFIKKKTVWLYKWVTLLFVWTRVVSLFLCLMLSGVGVRSSRYWTQILEHPSHIPLHKRLWRWPNIFYFYFIRAEKAGKWINLGRQAPSGLPQISLAAFVWLFIESGSDN